MTLYESLRESTDATIWYHGSSTKITKFLYSKVGTRDDHITGHHGFGIYFVDEVERAKKYGSVVTTIKLLPTANILSGKVSPEQCRMIYKQLERDGLATDDYYKKIFLTPQYTEYSILNDAEELYAWLYQRGNSIFETSKDTSDFLLRAGIDGMMVINDVNDKILVMFNDKVIEVV